MQKCVITRVDLLSATVANKRFSARTRGVVMKNGEVRRLGSQTNVKYLVLGTDLSQKMAGNMKGQVLKET